MYQAPGAMANSATGNQKPETFLLSPGAAQSLPQQAQIALHQVDNLKYFLISAPVDWTPDQFIRRFLLPTGEYVSCVLWNNLFHISGTDIVRCLAFRFQAFGRPVKNSKKFEEGIFSDLRNLKAGNDASLEEPKSAFLDFMYKNNCIRTQKKQKVFYWYSVPHDRLFLDALERDLKREKAGQEATTVANFEPALSFEFDASQSLFEQLTKAQQQSGTASAPTGAVTAEPTSYDQSDSPVDRSQEQMPPPGSMVPQSMQNVSQDSLNDMTAFSQPSIPASQSQASTRQDQYGSQVGFERPNIPMSQQQRHSSVPAYMEYSPAPSFVSSQSHFDEYSARGMSYEPITPPQATNYGQEPAYTATEDNGLYNALSDMPNNFGSMTSMAPPNYGAGGYTSIPKQYPNNPVMNNVYSHIEGSPNYKQRRRRSPSPYSSTASSVTTTARQPHAVRRPSDLRRSMSSIPTMPSTQFERAASGPPAGFGYLNQTNTMDPANLSRHGSPLSAVVDDQQQQGGNLMHPQQQQNRYGDLLSNNGFNDQMLPNGTAGAFRRARSATTDAHTSPYPQKSHSCPIPSCGRLFKRLEHLKRHVRTHTQERPYVCPHCSKAFSRSDNLAQHRRTHEGDENGNFPEDVNEDELDASDDLLPNLDDPSTNGANATPETPEQGFMQTPVQQQQQHQQQPMYAHQQFSQENATGGQQQQQQQQQQQHAFDPQLVSNQSHFGDVAAHAVGGAGMDMFAQAQAQGRMGPPPLPASVAQQGY